MKKNLLTQAPVPVLAILPILSISIGVLMGYQLNGALFASQALSLSVAALIALFGLLRAMTTMKPALLLFYTLPAFVVPILFLVEIKQVFYYVIASAFMSTVALYCYHKESK